MVMTHENLIKNGIKYVVYYGAVVCYYGNFQEELTLMNEEMRNNKPEFVEVVA